MRKMYVALFTGILLLSQMIYGDDNMTGNEKEKGYVVFLYSTMKRLPSDYVPEKDINIENVAVSMAKDEYESIQMGIHAKKDLNNIKITLNLPSGIEGTIYRGIDPTLAEKLASGGLTTPGKLPDVYLLKSSTFPYLPAGKTFNIWLTLHTDTSIPSGVHIGKIRIEPEGFPSAEISLEINVRPFSLANPRIPFGMYFCYTHTFRKRGSYMEGNELLAVYKDMVAHGQNSTVFCGAGDFSKLPPENSWLFKAALPTARKAGLIHPDIPCVINQHNIHTLSPEQRKSAVEWLVAERLKNNWPELVLYTYDEPRFPLPGFREAFVPLRKLPIRVGTAMSDIAAFGHGDFHDVWIVHDGMETPELLAEAQRCGAEVWTYSYRILREGGGERVVNCPLRQRYYAGLYTWANKLKGNFVWAYSHLDTTMSHAWWIPESDEPMPTVGWEGRREGIDDYRYLQMVEDIVTIRKKDPVTSRDPLTLEVEAWLEMLRARIRTVEPHMVVEGKPFDIEEYGLIRETAAKYIQKFESILKGKKIVEFHPELKDEAWMFRGKDVREMIEGLKSKEVSIRRSAACALAEVGSKGVGAIPELIRVLDDPSVRIPALRTLHSMGSDSCPAISKIALLLSHPDKFIRNAAMVTLHGITGEKWNLSIPPQYMGYDDPENIQPVLRASERYFREQIKVHNK